MARCDCGNPGVGGIQSPQQPLTVVPITARAQRPVLATGVTGGAEPLVIQTPIPDANSYWLVSHIAFIGIASVSPPALPPGTLPGSGLFIVPQSDVGETLAQAQATIGLRTRAIPLDTVVSVTAIGGGGGFAVSMVWRSIGAIVVPQGYIIVAILAPNPGTPAPGPGAGSSGQLSALVSVEHP